MNQLGCCEDMLGGKHVKTFIAVYCKMQSLILHTQINKDNEPCLNFPICVVYRP